MSERNFYQEAKDILWDFIDITGIEEKLLFGNYSLWWYFYPSVYNWLVDRQKNKPIEEKLPTKPVKTSNYFAKIRGRVSYTLVKGLLEITNGIDVMCVSNSTNWQLVSDGRRSLMNDSQFFLIEKELSNLGKRFITVEMNNPSLDLRTLRPLRFSFQYLKVFKRPRRIEFTMDNKFSREYPKLIEFLTKKISFSLGRLQEDILTAEDILKKLNVKKVLVTNENGSGRIFIIAAKKLGIKTVAVQHGIIHNYHPLYVYPKKSEFVPLADKTAVFGSFAKSILTEESIYEDKEVEVTGQSRTDIVDRFSRNMLLKNLNITGDRKIILLISQKISRPSIKLFLEKMNYLKKDMENLLFLIKLHPNEKNDGFYDFLEAKLGEGAKVIVTKNIDLYELLSGSDVVVATLSTVILEALLFKKPVVVMDLPGFPDFLNYKMHNVILFAKNSTDLVEKLANVLNNKYHHPNLDWFLSQHFNQKSNATKRIISLLD